MYIDTHTCIHKHIYMHTHICYTLFHILFHYGLLQDVEHSSLCHTVGPYCLSILHIVFCICYSQTPNLSLFMPFPLW